MGCLTRTIHGYQEAYYQDVWVCGKRIIKGARECRFRYEAMRRFFKNFKRPVTVLDIGANMGYFSLRLAEEFPGTFVMVEGSYHTADGLLKLCKLNQNPRTLLLKRSLNLKDLQELARVEHFDVVLALSILHHFQEPYCQVLEVLAQLGSYLILEFPNVNEGTLNQDRVIEEGIDLSAYASKVIATSPALGSPVYYRKTHLISCAPKQLEAPYWQAPSYLDGERTVQADFKNKRLLCPDGKKLQYPYGINFSTFLGLNGVYPMQEKLSVHLQALERKHPLLHPGQLQLNACLNVLPV